MQNHVHRTKKLYESEYFSLHKTKTMPTVDFDDQSAYDSIIETRVYKDEAIIVCFTASVVRWLIHYARMAQALGFDHFVVVGESRSPCFLPPRRLTAHAGCRYPPPGISSGAAFRSAARRPGQPGVRRLQAAVVRRRRRRRRALHRPLPRLRVVQPPRRRGLRRRQLQEGGAPLALPLPRRRGARPPGRQHPHVGPRR